MTSRIGELRQRCTDLTQEDVASLLNVTQAYVSKFERGEDALLSSLYGHIKALGGDLEIRALSGTPRGSRDAVRGSGTPARGDGSQTLIPRAGR